MAEKTAGEETDTPSDSDSALTELDKQYQRHRVFKQDGYLTVRIDNIGIDESNSPLLTLSIGGGETEVVVRLVMESDEYQSLQQLCYALGVPFEADLSPLVGRELNVEFDQEEKTVSIKEGGNIEGRVVTKTNSNDPSDLQPKLPETIVSASRRLYCYRKGDDVFLASIDTVEVTDNTLTLWLDIYNEPLPWQVSVPNVEDMDGSQFEQLSEKLGGGSPKMITGTDVWVTRLNDYAAHPSNITNLIDYVADEFSNWGIFFTRSDAESPHLDAEVFQRRGRRGDGKVMEFANSERAWARAMRYSGYALTVSFIGIIGGTIMLWDSLISIAIYAFVISAFARIVIEITLVPE